MTTKLEQAARALLAHWDTPAWKYLKPTGDLMADLREALAEQAEQIPQKERKDFIDGYNAGMADAKRMQQAEQEQEPVAWLWKPSKPFPQYTVITDKKEYLKAAKEQGVEITPLYAALVAAHEREACAKVCEEIAVKEWDAYKGRTEPIDRDKLYNPHIEGISDGADECAAAIRGRGEK